MKFLNDPLNLEFVRLLDASGWTKARAAEELDLQGSTISEYVTGNVRPSKTVLRLFKLILSTFKPESVQYDPEFRKLAQGNPLGKRAVTLHDNSPQYGVPELVREIESVPANQREPLVEALRGVTKAFAPRKEAKRKKAA